MENQNNSLLYFHIFWLLYYHNNFRDIYNKEYASLARYEAKKYSTSEMSFCAGAYYGSRRAAGSARVAVGCTSLHRAVESQNIVCKRLFFHVLDMKLETAFSKAEKRLELNNRYF